MFIFIVYRLSLTFLKGCPFAWNARPAFAVGGPRKYGRDGTRVETTFSWNPHGVTVTDALHYVAFRFEVLGAKH